MAPAGALGTHQAEQRSIPSSHSQPGAFVQLPLPPWLGVRHPLDRAAFRQLPHCCKHSTPHSTWRATDSLTPRPTQRNVRTALQSRLSALPATRLYFSLLPPTLQKGSLSPPSHPCLCFVPRAFSHLGADLAAQRKGGEGAGVDAVLVEVAHVDLHARVVLGGDQLVGPRAAVRGWRRAAGVGQGRGRPGQQGPTQQACPRPSTDMKQGWPSGQLLPRVAVQRRLLGCPWVRRRCAACRHAGLLPLVPGVAAPWRRPASRAQYSNGLLPRLAHAWC